MPLESDMRGLTYRQALNLPYLRTMHYIFFAVTMMFFWMGGWKLELLLLGYWAMDFSAIWLKWNGDNKLRYNPGHTPPERNPAAPESRHTSIK